MRMCPAGLSFEVVSLERVVEGSNIPVPKTLIKSVLNLVMPSVSVQQQRSICQTCIVCFLQALNKQGCKLQSCAKVTCLRLAQETLLHIITAAVCTQEFQMFCTSRLPLQVFTKLLLTSLPHELGQFILDSAGTAASSSNSSGNACRGQGAAAAPTSAAAAAVAAAGGAGVWLSGELCLSGPPLACLSACLTRSAEEVPAGRVSLTTFVQVRPAFTHS